MRLPRLIFTLLFAVAAPAVPPGQPNTVGAPAQGVRFAVDEKADGVDAAPGDGVCATATERCTLRAAIMEANALAGPSTIVLPAGTYMLKIGGFGEDAAASGDLDITGELTIVGAGPGLTFVQAGRDDRAFDILPSGALTVSGVRIRKGEIPQESGGGLRNHGSLTLIDVIVSSNRVSNGSGGGIFAAAGSVTRLVDTTIWHNATKGEGAGIYNDGGTLELINVTFSTNEARVAGGGLFNRGIVTAINSTFSSNGAPAGTGGGIANAFGLVQLKNTIVANTRSGGDCAGTITSLGHNLIEDPSGCLIEGEATGNLIGVNPKRGGLIEEGSEAGTYGLKARSPAIDAGSNDGCPPTDRRGAARPQDGNGDGVAVCDIGAFELQPE